jgi:hypothetical protein
MLQPLEEMLTSDPTPGADGTSSTTTSSPSTAGQKTAEVSSVLGHAIMFYHYEVETNPEGKAMAQELETFHQKTLRHSTTKGVALRLSGSPSSSRSSSTSSLYSNRRKSTDSLEYDDNFSETEEEEDILSDTESSRSSGKRSGGDKSCTSSSSSRYKRNKRMLRRRFLNLKHYGKHSSSSSVGETATGTHSSSVPVVDVTASSSTVVKCDLASLPVGVLSHLVVTDNQQISSQHEPRNLSQQLREQAELIYTLLIADRSNDRISLDNLYQNKPSTTTATTSVNLHPSPPPSTTPCLPGSFLFCGDLQSAVEIQETLISIFQLVGSMERKEAINQLRQLKDQGRLVIEVWNIPGSTQFQQQMEKLMEFVPPVSSCRAPGWMTRQML